MSTTTPDLTVQGPAGLVSIVPHLCGFTPKESVVLVWMGDDTRISLTQRVDIELIDAPEEEIYDCVMSGAQHGPKNVAAVIWSEREVSLEAVGRVVKALDRTGVYVLDVLTVRGDRWRSATCVDEFCCPPEGREIDPYSNEAATMVALGSAPAASRDAVLIELAPTGQARTQAPVYKRPGDLTKWRKRVTDNPEKLTPAELAGALHDIRVRDTLLWDIIDKGTKDEWVDRFAAATRASHPDDAAPAATLYATFCWLTGGGPNVYVGLAVAMAADEDYSMMMLVGTAVRNGVPPTAMAEAIAMTTRDDCLYGRK